MAIAKTEASGGHQLLPEVLAFSSSLALDKALLLEDIVGSLAHVLMLAKQGIVPKEVAHSIREGLVSICEEARAGSLKLPEEEDIHMAVEAELSARIGAPAARLHTARSRNDQVSTDLRLHVRESTAEVLRHLSTLLEVLVSRMDAQGTLLLPSYTHRQRAQPVTLGFWLASHGAALARDVELFGFVLKQLRLCSLGAGAIAGTSLPIERAFSAALLGFEGPTHNAMDTVGERDFGMDYLYAASRLMLHLSRLCADVIDYTSLEFGFAVLDGEIACGSSMMPQKRNPDIFELIRGKSGRALGNLLSLMSTMKGLPAGYNRDLQEDRQALLETGPMLNSCLQVLGLAMPRLHFDAGRCKVALEDGYTQATDLAEALVKKGMAFREAYQAVGSLVRRCQEAGIFLSKATVEMAKTIHPAFDEETMKGLLPENSVMHKASLGSCSPEALWLQRQMLLDAAGLAQTLADEVVGLDVLYAKLKEVDL
ncbi:MAG: argininosuccinate lyase [Cystobacterineae bacterium]|nr:argininosuccinate lyase [Cystobacterineae bacterium]